MKTVLMKKKKKGIQEIVKKGREKKKKTDFFPVQHLENAARPKNLTILPVFGKKLEGKQLKLKPLFQITPKVQLLTLATPYCIYRS